MENVRQSVRVTGSGEHQAVPGSIALSPPVPLCTVQRLTNDGHGAPLTRQARDAERQRSIGVVGAGIPRRRRLALLGPPDAGPGTVEEFDSLAF